VPTPAAATAAPKVDRVQITEALVIGSVTRERRTPVRIDPIEAALVRGVFAAPEEGTSLALPDGRTTAWAKIVAGDDGFFRDEGLRGGYAFVRIESDAPRAMLLDATGHAMVYVNGEPRTGDQFQYGNTILPIELRAGTNSLLFRVNRGVLRAQLSPLPEPPTAMLDRRDLTAPDLLVGAAIDSVMGVLVVNPRSTPLVGAVIRSSIAGAAVTESPVPQVPAFAIVKAPVRIVAPPPSEPGPIRASLTLVEASSPATSQLDIDLRVVDAASMRRETFVSSIDGSVQYFAVQPASAPPGERPGIILSLHGASVEASSQAAAYQRKSWAHVVAPTNRRPFGFDWEDWGRLDALEVLDIARRRLGSDPQRQWLTGHSMGGHGAWQLGVHHPDLFAAVAPSAGWIAFPGGGPDTDPNHPVGAILNRAALPSQTLALRENLARQGVFVLHGDADDNVPVSNARTMRSELGQFHGDFVYSEQPGAGHWWGNECVDWPPLTEFLRARSLRPSADRSPLVFVTASPSVGARCDWALVDAQSSPFERSRIELSRDVASRTLSGTTTNVARLAIDLPLAGITPGAAVQVQLDGTNLTNLEWPAAGRLWLERIDGGAWQAAPPPSPFQKNHLRGGAFKDAFRNRMVFVYGTQGAPEENSILRSKARYDAETFWYRANGAVEVIPDSQFDLAAYADRNVILFGNSETNLAWRQLLRESPVQVDRSGVRLGSKSFLGDDLCCVFVRPRPDSAVASVAAVSGTGIAGTRLSERLPYFTSGIGYPDVMVVGSDMHERGVEGIRAAGFFGNDWSIENGVFGFSPPPSAAPSTTPAPSPAEVPAVSPATEAPTGAVPAPGELSGAPSPDPPPSPPKPQP